jgi:hypothetical protein
MKQPNKYGLLAKELQNIFRCGVVLSRDVVHYIDSTFFNPTIEELQEILLDDCNCEKDSLMELLFFADEAMQIQLEAMLERLHFQKIDEKLVAHALFQPPLSAVFRFPGHRGSLHLAVTEDIACQFITRLNISKHLNPGLLEVLNRYEDENIRNRIKVKMRNSRFSPTENQAKFLGLFFEKLDSRDNDFFGCLEFALNFLDEPASNNDVYRALMAKKKFYFGCLQKAKRLDSQLRKHNLETLMARGKRIVQIDPEDARQKMQMIDRISRAVFDKTEYLKPPCNGQQRIPQNDGQVF